MNKPYDEGYEDGKKDEREACAQVAEKFKRDGHSHGYNIACEAIAAAIRARKTPMELEDNG